jgi:hypothetical protein
MMYIFNTRPALLITGRMVLIPREAEGIAVEQYVPTSIGPIFQAAGESKWLHQVTEEGKPVATSASSLAIVLPFVFVSASFGALATEQYHRGDFWVQSGLIAAALTVACKIIAGMVSQIIMCRIWGRKFEDLKDIGLRPACEHRQASL